MPHEHQGLAVKMSSAVCISDESGQKKGWLPNSGDPNPDEGTANLALFRGKRISQVRVTVKPNHKMAR